MRGGERSGLGGAYDGKGQAVSVSSVPPCSLIRQPSCHWCLYIIVLPHAPPPLSPGTWTICPPAAMLTANVLPPVLPPPPRYLDNLPTSGNAHGRAFRDLEWEERVLELTRKTGIGAQFGGK